MKTPNFLLKLPLALLIIISMSTDAQNHWLAGFGGTGNDEALKNTIDKSGNILTTGYFSQGAQFGSSILISNGSGDVFVTKQDASGNFLWAVGAGGSQSDRSNSIASDDSGNIYITGYYSGLATFGAFSLTSINSSQDIFVAKLNASGTFVWAKSFGGADIDLANAVQTDQSGNIIVTGQFRDSIQFGTFSIGSMLNPNSNLPGFDIFLAKIDSSGNPLWLKHGTAKYDDRGITLATDPQNNIYLSGQFSDTLQFTNTYYNNGYNASFLMKVDSSGNEIWFKKIFATQVLVNEIKFAFGKIYLTGDYQGTLSIIGNTIYQQTNPFQYKIFVLAADTSGQILYGHSDGSDNQITSLSIGIGPNKHPYCTGLFKCTFTSYSQISGAGVFNSAGFRDVFITEYDSMLERLSSRQFAGPMDDYCSAISILANNHPVIAGSFERNFNVPDNGNFNFNISNLDSSSLGPDQNAGYCSDNNYGQFLSIYASGNKDIFSASPFDSSRLTYDFFDRLQNNCLLDTVMPAISFNKDTVSGCDSVRIYITTHTGKPGIIGPLYDVLWSNGETADSIWVTTSGWYSANFQYKDECRIFNDSVFVKLYTTPPLPTISPSKGNIVTAIPFNTCFEKLLLIAPDTSILTGGNVPPGYKFHWTTPYGIVNNINANAYIGGNYSFIVETPDGSCQNSACIELYYYDTITGNGLPQNFIPKIYFIDSLFEATDTVSVCKDEDFKFILADSGNWSQGIFDAIPTYVEWNKTGGFHFYLPVSYHTTFFHHLQQVKADTSGNCTVTAQILNPFTLAPLVSVTRNFYLNIKPTPNPTVTINGPTQICPGDTVLLTITGGDNYSPTGPGIVAMSVDKDSLWVTKEGDYTSAYLVIDSISNCSTSGVTAYNLAGFPVPPITMFPSNGIICPNDSVQLVAEPGTNYIWTGPLGNIIGNTQSIYAPTPGLYHYTFTNTYGCTLVSEFREVKAYTTPYLFADPGPVLCHDSSITLQIYTLDSTQINWLAPLSGFSLTQTVNTAGVYSCSVTACTITTTVNITVTNTTLSADINPQGPLKICQNSIVTLQANPGMQSYTWMPGQGNSEFFNISAAGIYTVEVTDLYGCTAVDSIIVDTFPLPSPAITQNYIICTGDSILLSASGSGSINWYETALSTIPLSSGTTLQSPSLSTNTTYYVSNQDSICESIRTAVTVTMNPASIKPEITGDSIICKNDILELSTNQIAGINYNWTGPNGFISSQSTAIINAFDSINAGTYYLFLSDSQCTSPTDSIVVNLFQFTNFNISANSPLCEGDTIMLFADTVQQAIYNWSGPNGFTSLLQNPQIPGITANQSGTYILTIQENGCTGDPKNINVQVKPLPPIPIIAGNLNYCTGDTLKLNTTAMSGLIYIWKLPNGVQLAGTQIQLIAASNMTGNIVLITNLNGCFSRDSAALNVTPEPPHTIVASTNVCEGDSLNFSTVMSPGANYSWSGPAAFSSGSYMNTIANANTLNSGYYTLQVELNGCKSKLDSILLQVTEYPVFNLMNDTTICEGTSFQVSVPTGFDYYSWNGTNFSNTYTVTDSGMVILTATNNSICTTVDSFHVTVIDCSYILPNVFTPNGDNINDQFEFVYNNAKNISLTINNRWGQTIRTINGTIIQWDGKNKNNEEVTAGTYFYTSSVTDYFGRHYEFKGTITLIR